MFRRRLEEGSRCGQGGTHRRVEQRLCGRLHPQAQVVEAPRIWASGIRAAQSEDVGSLKNGSPTICRGGQSVSPRMRQNPDITARFLLAPLCQPKLAITRTRRILCSIVQDHECDSSLHALYAPNNEPENRV